MSRLPHTDPPPTPQKPGLTQLLRRRDLWRGHSQLFTEQASWSTGHAPLDQALLHGGWPLSTLVEVCQAGLSQAEWLLLGPAIRHACSQGGYVLLLNPPAHPYVPGLIQQKVNLDQLIVVKADQRTDFVASFIEILRSSVCHLLLSWEPAQGLSYAELRKCQLATTEHAGLSVLLRDQRQQQQNSPASLRLCARLQAKFLELQVFKQRGKHHNSGIQIILPDTWQARPLHRQLGQPAHATHSAKLLTFAQPSER